MVVISCCRLNQAIIPYQLDLQQMVVLCELWKWRSQFEIVFGDYCFKILGVELHNKFACLDDMWNVSWFKFGCLFTFAIVGEGVLQIFLLLLPIDTPLFFSSLKNILKSWIKQGFRVLNIFVVLWRIYQNRFHGFGFWPTNLHLLYIFPVNHSWIVKRIELKLLEIFCMRLLCIQITLFIVYMALQNDVTF